MSQIAYEAEQDRYLRTGIGYHLRHVVSGRWYCGRGRYSSDRRATFAGRREARRAVGGYFRTTESVFLEMVPFCMFSPEKDGEDEAARLLTAGSEPLVPKT